MDHFTDIVKGLIVPVTTCTAWFVDKLPSFAAFVSILWIGYQWWHSAPMVARRKEKKGKRK